MAKATQVTPVTSVNTGKPKKKVNSKNAAKTGADKTKQSNANTAPVKKSKNKKGKNNVNASKKQARPQRKKDLEKQYGLPLPPKLRDVHKKLQGDDVEHSPKPKPAGDSKTRLERFTLTVGGLLLKTLVAIASFILMLIVSNHLMVAFVQLSKQNAIDAIRAASHSSNDKAVIDAVTTQVIQHSAAFACSFAGALVAILMTFGSYVTYRFLIKYTNRFIAYMSQLIELRRARKPKTLKDDEAVRWFMGLFTHGKEPIGDGEKQ